MREAKIQQIADPQMGKIQAEQARIDREKELQKLEKDAELAREERIRKAAEDLKRKHAQGAQTTEELDN